MNTTSQLSTDFGGRLVPLCDGRPGLRAGLQVEAQAPPAGAIEDQNATSENRPIIDFVASSEALDRYDEIIVAAGWRLDQYRRNPVFQNAHQYGDIIFTLGKALMTEVRLSTINSEPSAYLFQRIEFAIEANPMARIAYALYQGKFLNAVSVGFIPRRWENGGPEAGYRRKYLETELLEVSAVGIPANPEALQLGLQAGAIQKADLQDLLEMVKALAAAKPATSDDSAPMNLPDSAPICSTPARAGSDPNSWARQANEAQMLQLARALRDILRRS